MLPWKNYLLTFGICNCWKYMKMKVEVTPLCLTLGDPGQNTGMSSLSLLQGIFPTQGSNPVLPCHRWILYQLSHKGSPRILEWVGCPFSSRFSWPRDTTRVSCTLGRFFTNWAMREALWKYTATFFYICYCPFILWLKIASSI